MCLELRVDDLILRQQIMISIRVCSCFNSPLTRNHHPRAFTASSDSTSSDSLRNQSRRRLYTSYPPHSSHQALTMNPWGAAAPPPWVPQPAGYFPPGYATPQYASYWAQPGWNAPTVNGAFNSVKYPTLNPILALGTTTVRYDVRGQARNEIAQAIYMPNRLLVATSNQATHVRLISKAFPWSIEIVSASPVTCEVIWDALYKALQEPIADSEWGIIILDRKQRETIEKAAKKRSDNQDARYKRIDWLGGATIFKGLEKLEEFQDMRMLPGAEPCAETWVVRMSTS
ncbi:unnamed protein product [Mycena citricolor]|uniref:DUF6699 domain-containing protein n=1 Tax=Mycena citricolor TaxID=2018698 RepID=A0AAD2GXU6_9AGAR|nr:unnamed protein product [Mycena citricolor]